MISFLLIGINLLFICNHFYLTVYFAVDPTLQVLAPAKLYINLRGVLANKDFRNMIFCIDLWSTHCETKTSLNLTLYQFMYK